MTEKITIFSVWKSRLNNFRNIVTETEQTELRKEGNHRRASEFDQTSMSTIIETIVKFKMSAVTVFFALHLHETIKGNANIKTKCSGLDITNPTFTLFA